MKKNITYLFLTTFLLFQSNYFLAQDDVEKCGTMPALEERIQNDPGYAKFYNLVNSDDYAERSAPCMVSPVTVPIAFHFDDSFSCADPQCIFDQIQDQIEALNVAFGDNTQDPLVQQLNMACPAGYPIADVSTGTEINFCLGVPPAGNAQGLDPACDPAITIGDFCGGINFCGGNGAGPDWAGFLNIFVVGPAGGLLGVADGIPGNGNGDGVTVTGSVFGGDDGGCTSGGPLDTDTFFAGGATLVHEIGHYLGIFHVWGDGGCGVVDFPNAGPCDVMDTPDMSGSSTNCPTVGASCAGLPQSCGNYEYFHNFMDYTSDACLTMFSQDQANVMNYWATQLFQNTPVACNTDQNPTVLTFVCEMQACVCPTMVTQPYAGAEDVCLIAGDYTLPTDLTAVTSDQPGTFVWSTGNYLSAGGTALTVETYTPAAPASCAPVTETLYLNLTCIGDPIQLDAGTLTLTVYPDPRNLAVTDLVAISDGDCNGPGVIITPGCEPYVTVTQNGGPAFPVTMGSGTVDYDVVLNYPAGCCEVPGAEIILEGTIMSTTFDDASADQVCDPNDPNFATPAIWQITFNIPPAQNATDSNPTGLGSIKEVCIDLTLNGSSDAVIMSLDSPDCNAYEWENLWLGTAFNGGVNTGSTTLCFTTGIPNGDFDGTYDGDDGTSSSFMGCLINGNMWDFWLADYNCYLGAATGGTLNSATITFCDGNEPPITGSCNFTAQANYTCDGMDCTDCADPACTTTIACDDMDCNTETDMETVLLSDNGVVCVTCAGTPITPPDCDDMDCNTDDSYDAATCTCVNDPITPPDCDDGDCNTDDSYDTATCTCVNDPITPPDCDDMDCNTDDSYDTATCTCVNDPITPPDCDDGDCNTNDSYDTATCTCINDPITPPDCDDGDCNTADVYNTATCMCENNPITPSACDDMDCTTDDSYNDVNCVCINTPIPPPDCDDADCNTTDSYDTATCTCVNDPITPPNCDDGDCNTDDSYDGAVCACVNTPITPPDPDDNCDFTDDSYDTATCTVINTPNCPDGSTFNAAMCSCDGCEDAITGSVTTDETTCVLTGIMVEILDSNGMPVAGSPVTIDAMGNYSLPGPFPCGIYTAELVDSSLPQCYTDLNGTTGPFEFMVDGDGAADGTDFQTLPQVPTLSQWGLMILALLLMSFGAIKIGTFRRAKAFN